MAGALTNDDLRRLARLGAMRRLEEIRREEAAIRSAFPELFGPSRPEAPRRPGRPRKAGAAAPAPAAGTGERPAGRGRKAAKRRRPTMSAAQKKAVSERMKKYWAERRKAKG